MQKLKVKNPALLIAGLWMAWLILNSFLFVCLGPGAGCGLGYFKLLSNWDGNHFWQIAESGYIVFTDFAFFPMLPATVFPIISLTHISTVVVGPVLNWVLTLIGVYFLFKLLRLDFKKTESLWIILLLLSFPLSFFFLTFYSESLFLALSVSALYFYRKKRLYLCILLLTLLTLTRMVGVALVFAIILDAYRKKGAIWKFFLPFLGIGIYIIYTYQKSGYILAIAAAEENWNRLIAIPGTSIYNYIWIMIREGVSYENYLLLFDLIIVVLALILVLRSVKYLSPLYWQYTLFSILIPLSTSTFLSFPRFLIVVFPLFISLYLMSIKIVRVSYVIVGFILLNILFFNFLLGNWVA